MSAWTDFARRLGIEHPLLLAPMAGGPGTPALAAAVSEAGGLGAVGAAYLAPEALAAEIADVRRRTRRPFAVNLFVPGTTPGADDPGPMLALLGRWHGELGLTPPQRPAPPADRFAAQLEVVLTGEVPVFSFTFGIPDRAVLAELTRGGTLTVGTATTVAEALALEAAGVDAVVAQGSEAGGHRGSFLEPLADGLVGTLALVPAVVDAMRVPVIAAGGIADGRGIAAARALGAAGVQLGTAFLATDEAGTGPAYRARLLAARPEETGITRAYSGRAARGIRTRFMAEVEEARIPIPPFPLQNALTRPLRNAARAVGNTDAMSLWAGQGLGALRTGSAGALVRRLIEESDDAIRRLAADFGSKG